MKMGGCSLSANMYQNSYCGFSARENKTVLFIVMSWLRMSALRNGWYVYCGSDQEVAV